MVLSSKPLPILWVAVLLLLFQRSYAGFITDEKDDITIDGEFKYAIELYERLGITPDPKNYDDDLDLVRKYDEVHGVDYGLCHFDGPVYNLTLVSAKNCIEVTSDLTIEGASGEWLDSQLSVVEGCIQVTNTELYNVNFLLNLTRVTCYLGNAGNQIHSNDYMCITSEDRSNLTQFFSKVETAHSYCPACREENYDSQCKTYVGPFVIDHTHSIKNLTEIVGNLTIKDYHDRDSINKKDKLIIQCEKCLDDDIPLIIQNSTLPPKEFFDHLIIEAKKPATAIRISGIRGYKMHRGQYAMLVDKMGKEIDTEHEEEGECYMAKGGENNAYSSEDLMNCEVVTGFIHFESTNLQNLHKCKWKKINTTEASIRFVGGLELIKLFAHDVTVYFKDEAFHLELEFVENVCMFAEVFQRARKWMIRGHNRENQNRVVVVKNDHCNTYDGNVTAFDLKEDDGEKFRIVHGTLHLEALSISAVQTRKRKEMGSPKDEVYLETDISRFKELRKVRKFWNYAKDRPAVTIDMCSSEIQLPEWLKKVEILSDREDDILLRVTGPAYKMNVPDYEFFVKRLGAHRVDIHPMLPGECYFAEALQDMTKLNGCETIIGNLRIEGATVGQTNGVIKQVTGCIRIIGTELENLDFLRFEIPYDISNCEECGGPHGFTISNNSRLCIGYGMFSRVSKELIQNNNMDCGNSSSVYEENIIIAGHSNESTLSHLSEIVELHGRIIISRNELESIDVFKKLKIIKHLGSGPAILIENNPNLASFKLPALEVIIALEEQVVVIRNTPNLVESDKKEYEKRVKKGKVLMETVEEPDKRMLHGTLFGFGVSIGIAAVTMIVTVIAVLIAQLVITVRSKREKKRRQVEAEAEAISMQQDVKTMKNSNQVGVTSTMNASTMVQEEDGQGDATKVESTKVDMLLSEK